MSWNFIWESGVPEMTNLGRFWKSFSGGPSMTFKSVPRYLHGYIETAHPRTELGIRWYPYKQEMTYNSNFVPTFRDVLYTHYFPRPLDDDQRVAYVAEKTGRSEVDVANEMFKMRRMRLLVGQSIRMKLMGKVMTPPQGMDYSAFEKKYYHASIEGARKLGLSWMFCHSFDPVCIYSPHYGFGDAVDCIFERNMRTSLQYTLTDVVVHKGIPRARLPSVKEDPKPPLQNIEPCLWEEYRLKFSVLANIVKQEQYVTDHFLDPGHVYQGMVLHAYPDHEGVVQLEPIMVPVDMEYGKAFLQHYYENFVQPLRGEKFLGY